MIGRHGTFTAVDESGNQYTVHVFRESVLIPATLSAPATYEPGLMEFRLANGDPVDAVPTEGTEIITEFVDLRSGRRLRAVGAGFRPRDIRPGGPAP